MKKIGMICASVLLLAGCGAADTAQKTGQDVTESAKTAGEKAAILGEDSINLDTEKVVQDNTDDTLMVTSEYLGSYAISDPERGTEVVVTVDGDSRKIVSNTLPNHDVGTFPNEGNPNTMTAQAREWTLPLNPTFTGGAQWMREAGVAINGVKFEPQTAERFTCASGEVYSIEALEGFLDFGVDNNNAHVQPTGEYHYHGISQNLVDVSSQGADLVHIGFANDGFFIYYSPSNQYTPSYALKTDARTGTDCAYEKPGTLIEQEMEGTVPDGSFVSDWEYVEGKGDLDKCNGIEIGGQYAYVITDEYPYIPRCLNGEVENTGPGAGGQGGPPRDSEGRSASEERGNAGVERKGPPGGEPASGRPGGPRGGQ